MSLNHQCPGLINSTVIYGDKVPLRVAVFNGCYYTLVNVFNIIIQSLQRPITMTYCDSYDGAGTSIVGKKVTVIFQN